MKTLKFKYCIIFIFIISFTSCDPFEFSPYEVPDLTETEKKLNDKNIERISHINITGAKKYCFAIIGDVHTEYSKLEDAVNSINKDNEILFVIHVGDITDAGLNKEYVWAYEKLLKLKVPCVVLIGNHDCLSNGKLIYEKMYGPTSFTFVFNNTKFVFFDNIVWENNNKYPDFNWLNSNLYDHQSYCHTFVFSHLPPFSEHVDDYCETTYARIMKSNKIQCSFSGHVHEYTWEQYYDDSETWYFTADYIKKKDYYKIYVSDTAFIIETVKF